ncbi:MAG: hypothetical protein Q8Q23_05050, partial [bacterium]|nr:hypothetical protein [bacterium]
MNKNKYLNGLDGKIINAIDLLLPLPDSRSFFKTQNALFIIGAIYESEPQIILKIGGDEELLAGIAPTIAAQTDIKLYKYEIAATELKKQREVMRHIAQHTASAARELAPSLNAAQLDIQATGQIKRHLFSSQMEATFLDVASEHDPALADAEAGPFAKLVRAFDRPVDEAFELTITKEDIEAWNLASHDDTKKTWIKNFIAIAPQATAGLRETQDVRHPWNPHYTTNIIGNLLSGLAFAEIAANGKSFTDMHLLAGGEVRYATESNVNLLSRLWAGMGITVHRPPEGTKTTIWGATFIIGLMSWDGGIYFTSSHSGRNIFSGKILSNEGSQLYVEEIIDMVRRIEQKLMRVLKTGEPLTLKFSAATAQNISPDLDNTAHPHPINLRGHYADYLRKGVATDQLIADVQTATRNGLRMGYGLVHGCMGDNMPPLLDILGINETLEYHNLQKDAYFGGIGIDNYNIIFWSAQENEPLRSAVEAYVERYINPADFADRPINDTLTATIATNELFALTKRQRPDTLPETTTITFRVDAAYADDLALVEEKKMSYRRIPDTEKMLIYYVPKFIDLSQDLTLLEVIKTMGYDYSLAQQPVGHLELTTDPDGDRLVFFQIEPNTSKTRECLQELGVASVYINDKKILAFYNPNQLFLMTMNYRKRQLIASGLWEQYDWFLITTTVSAASWLEWAAAQTERTYRTKRRGAQEWVAQTGIPALAGPVGFKEIAGFERKVEKAIRENKTRVQRGEEPQDVIVHDVYGTAINLGKNPAVLFAGEQSGGMTLGRGATVPSLDGSHEFIAMRDKSAGEASVALLGLVAELYNQKRISLAQELKRIYDDNHIIRKYDVVVNNNLYDATAPIEIQKVQKELGVALRDRNNAFYIGLAFAFADGAITIEQIQTIL